MTTRHATPTPALDLLNGGLPAGASVEDKVQLLLETVQRHEQAFQALMDTQEDNRVAIDANLGHLSTQFNTFMVRFDEREKQREGTENRFLQELELRDRRIEERINEFQGSTLRSIEEKEKTLSAYLNQGRAVLGDFESVKVRGAKTESSLKDLTVQMGGFSSNVNTLMVEGGKIQASVSGISARLEAAEKEYERTIYRLEQDMKSGLAGMEKLNRRVEKYADEIEGALKHKQDRNWYTTTGPAAGFLG